MLVVLLFALKVGVFSGLFTINMSSALSLAGVSKDYEEGSSFKAFCSGIVLIICCALIYALGLVLK
ncbi:MAG TPA: hypothetical protein VL944_01490 [Candidatus Acidoferrum sp.]|nr:hypothetical protein [Candidatus Acidoferrum sp.]